MSPLEELDLIYDLAASWIDSPDTTVTILAAIAQQELINIGASEAELRQRIKAELRRYYESSKKHVEQRLEWEEKVCL